jgi:putative endonuclease
LWGRDDERYFTVIVPLSVIASPERSEGQSNPATNWQVGTSLDGFVLRHDGAAMKQPCVYIMANKRNGTLYTGVTSNLLQRAYQHRTGLVEGFTKKYGCKMLVWFEAHDTMEQAIIREKLIKGGDRKQKLYLIETLNTDWRDLYETLI